MNHKRVLNLFERLVKQNSTSKEINDINECQRIIMESTADLPLEWEIIQKKNAANMIVARTKVNNPNKPTIILSGHIDTVLKARGFEIRNQTVYGSGVNDMKGGIVSMLEVIRQLEEEGVLSNIIIAISPEEEIATPNYQNDLAEIAKSAEYVLVFEANRAPMENNKYKTGTWELAQSRKGALIYQIIYKAPGGHSGEIDKKENRVSTNLPVAESLINIEKISNYTIGTTLNPGQTEIGIEGAVNILPSNARIIGEARYWTRSERDRVIFELKEMVEKQVSKYNLISGSFEIKGEFPPLQSNTNTKYLGELSKQIALSLDIDLYLSDRAESSEANFFSKKNTNIAVLDGFGVWGQDEHRITESASLKSLEDSILLSKNLIKKILIDKQHPNIQKT